MSTALVYDCPGAPRWSFTQGILLGQFSMVILAVLFLKYVVFEDPAIAREQARSRLEVRSKRAKLPRSSKPSPLLPTVPVSAILSALTYDLPTHAPESLDWLNVLLAQTLSAYRTLIVTSTAGEGGAKGLMEEVLNRQGAGEGDEEGAPGLVGIDRIVVSAVEVGDKFPVLSNARVRPSGERGGVRIELDLDYTDHVSLSLSTCLLVNFPRPRFAVLPISLGLTLERFSGTLTVELPSPSPASSSPASPPAQPSLLLSLHPDFTLNLSTTSLLGSRAKLQDVPKVEQLLLTRIRGFIQDRVVWPARVEVALPPVASASTREAESPIPLMQEGLDGAWEWVEESEHVGVPNADSDDDETSDAGVSGSYTALAPEPLASGEFETDFGPTVHLHAKVRTRRPAPPPPAPIPLPEFRPPSPTESLPGHYYRTAEMGPRVVTGGRGRWEPKKGTPSLRGEGMRYRNGGVGSVGVGVAVGPGSASAGGGMY